MVYIIVIGLILLSGLFSGLTLGLLSLDKNELKRKISLGNKDAKRVYPVRKKGNLLLCTLLLGNVGVNTAIAIFFGGIASGLLGGIIATVIIVIFGEIVPQAVFARHALYFGAKMAWLVKIFLYILLPISWPLAWVLDKILGDEMTTIYSKKELMKIVEEHEDSKESDVDADEERIIIGALSFSGITAKQIMTASNMIFALEKSNILDSNLLSTIKEEGFTRIPVYDKTIDNIIGILYTKDLINIDKNKEVEYVSRGSDVLEIKINTKLDELLNTFIKSKNHMAFVKNEKGKLEGIVTLEDVVEEILKQEIMDETDIDV